MRILSNERVVGKVFQLLISLLMSLSIVGVHPSQSLGTMSTSQLTKLIEEKTIASNVGDISLPALKGEEKEWYEKFQNGLLFFDGWKKITKEILFNLPHEDKKVTKNFLKLLGQKIGSEWCKANSIRKIDTDMLLQWGNNLKEILRRNPNKITETLRAIDSDVNRILLNQNDVS